MRKWSKHCCWSRRRKKRRGGGAEEQEVEEEKKKTAEEDFALTGFGNLAKSTRDVVIVAYSAQSFMSFIDPHFLRLRPRFLKLRLVVASSSLAKTWGEGHLIPT